MEENKTKVDNNEVKEISDDDLQEVTGGNLSLHFFNTPEEVRFIFYVGDVIRVKETIFSSKTKCVVVRREVFKDPQYNCYLDAYVVRGLDGSDLYTRILRDDVVNEA